MDMRRVEGKAQEAAMSLQQCQEEPGSWWRTAILSFFQNGDVPSLRMLHCWSVQIGQESQLRLRLKSSELQSVEATLAAVQPEAQRLAMEEAKWRPKSTADAKTSKGACTFSIIFH